MKVRLIAEIVPEIPGKIYPTRKTGEEEEKRQKKAEEFGKSVLYKKSGVG